MHAAVRALGVRRRKRVGQCEDWPAGEAGVGCGREGGFKLPKQANSGAKNDSRGGLGCQAAGGVRHAAPHAVANAQCLLRLMYSAVPHRHCAGIQALLLSPNKIFRETFS